MISDKNKSFLARYGSENHIDQLLNDKDSYKGDGSLGSIIYGSGTRVHSILYNPHITTKNLRKMIENPNIEDTARKYNLYNANRTGGYAPADFTVVKESEVGSASVVKGWL